MYEPISAKEFRDNMAEVLTEVKTRGKKYTIIYRSKPMVDIVPRPMGFVSKKNSEAEEYRRILDEARGIAELPVGYDSESADYKSILREELEKKYGV